MRSKNEPIIEIRANRIEANEIQAFANAERALAEAGIRFTVVERPGPRAVEPPLAA